MLFSVDATTALNTLGAEDVESLSQREVVTGTVYIVHIILMGSKILIFGIFLHFFLSGVD